MGDNIMTKEFKIQDWYLNNWTKKRLTFDNIFSMVQQYDYEIIGESRAPWGYDITQIQDIVCQAHKKGNCLSYALIDDLFFLYLLRFNQNNHSKKMKDLIIPFKQTGINFSVNS
jgi:hypothetical protein